MTDEQNYTVTEHEQPRAFTINTDKFSCSFLLSNVGAVEVSGLNIKVWMINGREHVFNFNSNVTKDKYYHALLESLNWKFDA